MTIRKKQVVTKLLTLTDYAPFLAELKARVLSAQITAARG